MPGNRTKFWRPRVGAPSVVLVCDQELQTVGGLLYFRRGNHSSREHFANYRRQFRHRSTSESFAPAPSKRDYIFALASIWNEDEAPQTNQHRAVFIEVCKSLPRPITFEGGFVSSRPRQELGALGYHVLNKGAPFEEYLQKTKSSAVVFNTPAVWSCHGWKLGEFLALGKAIISTQLVRELPSPLIHGTHIHYVDGSRESISAAVELLLSEHG